MGGIPAEVQPYPGGLAPGEVGDCCCCEASNMLRFTMLCRRCIKNGSRLGNAIGLIGAPGKNGLCRAGEAISLN